MWCQSGLFLITVRNLATTSLVTELELAVYADGDQLVLCMNSGKQTGDSNLRLTLRLKIPCVSDNIVQLPSYTGMILSTRQIANAQMRTKLGFSLTSLPRSCFQAWTVPS